MNTMKKNTLFLVLILFSLFMGGCKYDFILPEEVPVIDNGGNPISFATKVAPIFSTEDCISCHKSGVTSPDLTAANSYSQIVPKYVNTTTPADSKLLTYPGPTTGTHTWKKLTANEAALILAWITEGAKNN